VVKIAEVYGRQEAMRVIRLSMDDYVAKYGTQADRLALLRQLLAEA
jgi:pantothenate kinase-related protein Tda10